MEDLELKKQAIEIIIQGAKEVGIELKESDFDLSLDFAIKSELKLGINENNPRKCLMYLFEWGETNRGEFWDTLSDAIPISLSVEIDLPKIESIEPKHYQLTVKNRITKESINCDFFDIGNALNLPIELFTAFRYFRIKGDKDKQINDLEKAKKCIDAYIELIK